VTASDRVTVVLLAGGPATRLPGKLALDVDGEPMLVRVYRRLTLTGWPCVISARAPLGARMPGDASYEVALDDVPDGGPLVGLRNAADLVRTPLMFAAAADLPNLSVAFASRLLAAYDAAGARAPHAVLPTWPDGKVEPLAALYDTQAYARGAAAALAAGRRKVTAALDGLEVLAYPVRSEDEDALLNVNTPQDYERLRASGLPS
jgi:molybdopterin-guanine dinucleotide biosynthesis protein A